MIVGNVKHEILQWLVFEGAMETDELRHYLNRDPHPTIGRMKKAGIVERDQFGNWYLTELGMHLANVSHLERQ